MEHLYETAGSCAYDDIFAGVSPTAHTANVKLGVSEKPIVRGTVLTGTAGGQLKPASEALSAENAIYICADTVDSAEADDVVTAYVTGCFALTRLATDGSYELTAADVETLRKSGFVIEGIAENIEEPAE